MRRWLWAGLALAGCGATAERVPARLEYLATAQQFGPVSFRDPLGVLSPDGQLMAWSVQHHLYLRRVEGGPIWEPATEPGLIAHLAWLPDSRGLIAEHRGRTPRWWTYDLTSQQRGPLFSPGQRISPTGPLADSLRQLAISREGRAAAVRDSGTSSELWIFGGLKDSAQVIRSTARLSFPFFAPDGHVACLAREGPRQVLRDPCSATGAGGEAGVEAYGPAAFSRGGDSIYYASPNPGGTLDLWVRPTRGGRAVRLTAFSRDAYAPTVSTTGAALFKLQTYRTLVGVIPATGGPVTPLASFQSETPSWDPTGEWIGITYGTWRRVVDDFRYPDIAQDAGIIKADPDTLPSAPVKIVDDSPSEDQSMTWSPNGKWIAYHSHKDLGDDLWLVPADRSAPARRLTNFGRGFETGWPRWSPDGKWLAFDADSGAAGKKSVIYTLGIDQETGAVTDSARALAFDGFSGEAVHAEWLGGSDRLAVLGDETASRHVILLGSREGGAARVLHRWESEHLFSGLGASPDGKWIAFVAPDTGKHFQIFRIPAEGGAVEQLTFDPTNKTQPAYSPDGKRIALTVWEYSVAFWMVR